LGVSGPEGSLCGVDSPPEAPRPNRCTQKLRFSPKVLSKSDRFSGRIPPGVYRRATVIVFPSLGTPGMYPRVHLRSIPGPTRGSIPGPLGPVRLQLLPLWPWRGHTPECGGGSATPNATILTRTPVECQWGPREGSPSWVLVDKHYDAC